MIDLYNNIVEKGGIYGILCVVLIILLSLLIRKIKDTSDSSGLLVGILKLLRIFLFISSFILFFQLFDNSNLFKWVTTSDNSKKQDTSFTTLDTTNGWENQSDSIQKPKTNYTLQSNRFVISATQAFLLTDDGYLTYIKMEKEPGLFNGNWHENKYSKIPISIIKKITVFGLARHVSIEYNLNTPADTFIPEEGYFNETNFTFFVEYGLKRFNKKIILEKNNGILSAVFVIVILVLMFYFMYKFFMKWARS